MKAVATVAPLLLPPSLGRTPSKSHDPSILTLQDILKHCQTSPEPPGIYKALLPHGDVVAAKVNYLPGALLWLVTPPTQDNRACQHMNARLVFLSSGLVGEYIVPSGYRRCMLKEGYAEGGSWTGASGWRDGGAKTGL